MVLVSGYGCCGLVGELWKISKCDPEHDEYEQEGECRVHIRDWPDERGDEGEEEVSAFGEYHDEVEEEEAEVDKEVGEREAFLVAWREIF